MATSIWDVATEGASSFNNYGYRGLYTKEISNKDSTELSIMKCIEQLTGSKVMQQIS